jgi:hypothetical protein
LRISTDMALTTKLMHERKLFHQRMKRAVDASYTRHAPLKSQEHHSEQSNKPNRMREHRERKKAGTVMVARIPITESERDELVAAGYLQEWSDGDAKAIEAAARNAWADLFKRYT